MKTILVPVDLSRATARICDAARDLGRLIHARLVLVHVMPPQPVYPGDFFAFDAGALAELVLAEERRTKRKLHALARRYANRNMPVQTRQSTGQPAAEILKHATSSKADYIVIGSHGHGRAYDLLIGSAAQGVLRRARCAVVVIPINRN